MKHFPSILTALVCLSISGYAVWGSGVANNTQSNASQVQGSDPAGNSLGYPFAIVNATGTSIDCNLTGSAINQSVTQGTSPWIVGQDAGSNPWAVNGTVTSNQGTASLTDRWLVGSSSAGILMVDGDTNTPNLPQGQFAVNQSAKCYPLNYNGSTWDRQRSANGAANTTGTGLQGAGLLGYDGTNWQSMRQAATSGTSMLTGVYPCALYLFNGSSGFNVQVQASAIADVTGGGSGQAVYPWVWSPGGPNGNAWTKSRTPTTFNTVATAAAGNTALWTPAAGKKFRLMRYMIEVTEQATQAAGGTINITLFDGAAGATGQVHDVYVPGAALGAAGDLYTSPWIDLGNGYLSAAANNVLNVNLSAALTAGTVRVICAGTEE